MTMKSKEPPIQVTGLYRYAVKGLSGDALSTVSLGGAGETFPDDRRYALLYEENLNKFNGKDWLHKENFLCAFTDPVLMSSFQSCYETNVLQGDGTTERLLQIKDRGTGEIIFKSTNLAAKEGREQLGHFLSERSGKTVVCVTADDFGGTDQDMPHRFQFGNTSSGYKKNKGDTRTVHIVNQRTVDAVSDAIGIPLDPRRFRPNIVIDGPPPFAEFDWVEKNHQQSLLTADGQGSFRPLSRTVRCRGISIDPDDTQNGQIELDIPGLLAKHFPQHGPYLGIYACVDKAPCSVTVGDELKLSSVTAPNVKLD